MLNGNPAVGGVEGQREHGQRDRNRPQPDQISATRPHPTVLVLWAVSLTAEPGAYGRYSGRSRDGSIDTRLTGLQQVGPSASWGRLLRWSVRRAWRRVANNEGADRRGRRVHRQHGRVGLPGRGDQPGDPGQPGDRQARVHRGPRLLRGRYRRRPAGRPDLRRAPGHRRGHPLRGADRGPGLGRRPGRVLPGERHQEPGLRRAPAAQRLRPADLQLLGRDLPGRGGPERG